MKAVITIGSSNNRIVEGSGTAIIELWDEIDGYKLFR